MLLKSLALVGAVLGLFLGIIGTSVPALFPNIFTSDLIVISQVSLTPNTEIHQNLFPYCSLMLV